MSLKEKLGGLSKILEEQKKTKEKSEEDKRLEPIRVNIKNLESSRKNLALVKGSLDFKAPSKSEKINKKIKTKFGEINVLTNKEASGMQDYLEQTDTKIKSKSGEIDTLILENKEALKELGIEDRDQLAVHPEFVEEPEVIEYHKALEQGEGLKMSDAKLKEKLITLGVEFDAENFSYESASQAVEKKIVDIDKELIVEKLKTPEGKEEVINNLAEEFKKSTGKLELHSFSGSPDKSMAMGYEKDRPDYSYGFGTDQRNFSVNFKDEKAKVTDWYNLKLIPDNFKDIEAAYGEDIAREALEKTYQNKVHENFSRWDETGDKAVSLKEQIKAVSPEERQAVKNKLNEFSEKQNEALRVLKEKSAELKGKGIEFNPDHVTGYGGAYQELLELDSRGTAKYISENLYKNDFPPQYDFVKLQEIVEKRMEHIDQFIKAIQNIQDEEGVKDLLENHDSDTYVGKFHKNQLGVDFREGVQFKLKGNNNGAISKLTEKCKTYQQAEDYLNEIIEKNAAGENKVSEAIINTIKAQLKLRELEAEIKNEGIGNQVYNLENKIKEISRNKEDATKVMGEIESLQSELSREPELSKENLILSDSHLIIPSIKKEYDDLRENKPLKQKEWENKKTERERQEETKPGLFGKEKWQKKLDLLKGEEASAEIEYRALDKQDQNALYYKAYRLIDSDPYTPIGKMVQSHKAQGNASEIFNSLREELTKVIDTTLPPKILQDYAEYKALAEKIG